MQQQTKFTFPVEDFLTQEQRDERVDLKKRLAVLDNAALEAFRTSPTHRALLGLAANRSGFYNMHKHEPGFVLKDGIITSAVTVEIETYQGLPEASTLNVLLGGKLLDASEKRDLLLQMGVPVKAVSPTESAPPHFVPGNAPGDKALDRMGIEWTWSGAEWVREA